MENHNISTHWNHIKEAGGFTVTQSFIAMFENVTMNMSHMVALFGNSQGVVEGQHFYQATENGARTANICARQSTTHFLMIVISQCND